MREILCFYVSHIIIAFMSYDDYDYLARPGQGLDFSSEHITGIKRVQDGVSGKDRCPYTLFFFQFGSKMLQAFQYF